MNSKAVWKLLLVLALGLIVPGCEGTDSGGADSSPPATTDEPDDVEIPVMDMDDQ